MQARLSINRFPTRVVALVVALFAALTLGGSLGYTLKPATVISGATHTIVVPVPAPAQAPASGDHSARMGGPLS
jgi:hypothetical protein